MKKILLDTNAYSSFLSGDQTVFDYIIASEIIYVSTVMLGVLFAGFHGGSRASLNRKELNRFLSKPGVQTIDVTVETSEIFGELKAALVRQGKMIPINDIWIAAHTVETGSKLITYDSHFRHIPGLRIWEELKT